MSARVGTDATSDSFVSEVFGRLQQLIERGSQRVGTSAGRRRSEVTGRDPRVAGGEDKTRLGAPSVCAIG